MGVEQHGPADCWVTSAALEDAYSIALGDAYALATAHEVDGTLLVGADDDFDGVTDSIERFRDEPA